MNVIGFLHTIRSQFAAALAMPARIRKQDSVAVFQQQMSVADHAFAIISNSVEQNHRVAIVVTRMDKPAFECHSISRLDRHFLQFSVEISSHHCNNGLAMQQGQTVEFQTEIGYDDACQKG